MEGWRKRGVGYTRVVLGSRTPLLVSGVAVAALAAVALSPAHLSTGASAPVGQRVSSAVAPSARIPATEPIRYGRDIRPILSDRCFLCHGPDRAHQQAGG